MENQPKGQKYKEILDELQMQSWQLELLISGFAIFGLVQSIEPLEIEQLKAIKNNEGLYTFMLAPILSGVYVLIFVLIFHVILRGLWIGTLGLRYVSGDIDLESLNYHKKFSNFLQKRVGSFDSYITKLENICSTLFALAFLMVFYLISFFTILGVFPFIVWLISLLPEEPKILPIILTITFMVPYILGLVLYFIDFISGGWLKRSRRMAKVYYPVYRFFGWISLSFLYRPLVYNFLDMRKAKWLSILIMPSYFLLSTIPLFFGKISSNLQIKGQVSNGHLIKKNHYLNMLEKETDMVNFAAIPSKIIEKNHLPVFIAYNDFMEDVIFAADTSLKPEEELRGYRFSYRNLRRDEAGMVNVSVDLPLTTFQINYLKKFNELYNLKIDTIPYHEEYVLTNGKSGRLGFETVLYLKNLKKGKHILRFIGPSNKNDISKIDTLITIPFWYYPDN